MSNRGQQGVGRDADLGVDHPDLSDCVRGVDDVVVAVEDETVLRLGHGDRLQHGAGGLVHLVDLGLAIVARVEDGLRPRRDRSRPRVGGGDGVLSDPGGGVGRVDHADVVRAQREPDVRVRPGSGGDSQRIAACTEQLTRLQELEHRRPAPPSPGSLPPWPSSPIRHRTGPGGLPSWDVACHDLSAPLLPLA